MQSTRIVLASVAVSALVLAMVSPEAVADPSSGPPTSTTIGRPSKLATLTLNGRAEARALTGPELKDLRALAKSKGQSVSDLQRKYRDRQAFDALTDELSQLPTYVQAGYAEEATDTEVWIRFTEKPAASTLNKIAGGLSYEVRIEYGSALGWRQLNDTMERLFLLTVQQPGVSEVTAAIGSRDDSIGIAYTGTGASMPTSDELAGSVAQLAAREAIDLGRIEVTFTEAEDVAKGAAEATVRGGYSLSTSTVEAHCTSGIPLSKNGQKGISTAMHCTNGLRYGGVHGTGIIQYRNAASTTSSGAHIDLQWHSTLSGSSTSASFYDGPGSTRAIYSSTNAVVNDYVCHYGMGTGYGCEYVHLLGACYTPEDLTFCGLAVLDRWITDGGDSGGPWFNGNNIKGVHSGRALVGGVLRSVYTPQTRIAENLDGSVLKA